MSSDDGGPDSISNDGPFQEFLSGTEKFIFSKGESGGIAGSIKIGKLFTAVVGSLILALYTIPIKIIQTTQTAVTGAVDAAANWLVDVLEQFLSRPVETIGDSVGGMESFIGELGILGLPVTAGIGLATVWLLWRVLS